MKNINEVLQEKGYIDSNDNVRINALNSLSAQTTAKFVYALHHYIEGDNENKVKSLTEIYGHFSLLYNNGNVDGAIRFLNVLTTVMKLKIAEDVEFLLRSETTKRNYLYALAADFYEILYDLRLETGLTDDFKAVEQNN
jgi:hypothetical protein